MNLDILREILRARLDRRVAIERAELTDSGAVPADYDSYFKDVFGGALF